MCLWDHDPRCCDSFLDKKDIIDREMLRQIQSCTTTLRYENLEIGYDNLGLVGRRILISSNSSKTNTLEL